MSREDIIRISVDHKLRFVGSEDLQRFIDCARDIQLAMIERFSSILYKRIKEANEVDRACLASVAYDVRSLKD